MHLIFRDFSYLSIGSKYVQLAVHADILWSVGIKRWQFQVKTPAISPLSVLAH